MLMCFARTGLTCTAHFIDTFLYLFLAFVTFRSSYREEFYLIAVHYTVKNSWKIPVFITWLKTVEKYLYFIFSKTPGFRRRIGADQFSRKAIFMDSKVVFESWIQMEQLRMFHNLFFRGIVVKSLKNTLCKWL